ncbi:hypothetical protein [Parasphingorhabdus cellanae]|uniref:DUF2846 domain-containing protein n=1 Tax=Parasphingorhabdus cellanae TaxID=2806553 RepID=A0ABX7T4Z3_9SPHN|nr:hypothetical protein [Parasphingorhabdus cellanae]QTD56201.1 hypothetical protein J4G78_00920 [Parasphingorhabdus cellanae]
MKMTPLNIAIFAGAIIIGMFLGLQFSGFAWLLIPLAIFVVVVLMRNKSGDKADPAETAEAMKMIPATGKARIYVMRKGFVAGQQGMNITIGDQFNSQIRSKYFLMAEVEPGTHEVTAQMSSGSKSAAVSHEVTLAEGEIALLDMKINMGALQGKPDFTEIRDAREANGMLTGLKLVKWK